MSPPLRYGILGCGDAARRLFIPGLAVSARAELTAVASRSPDRAERLAAELGCSACSSYEELLLREDIDVVYVGVPIAQHVEWALRALAAGKHVYCEKTMAPTQEHTEAILDAAAAAELRVAEGLMFRFHPLAQRVRDTLADDVLGRLHSFVGSIGFTLPADDELRRDPASAMGVLNESACYPICAARLMFGREPRRVSLQVRRRDGVDWSGSALLQFGEGSAAYCEFGWDLSYRNSYALWGERGELRVDRAYTTPPTMHPVIGVEAEQSRRIVVPAANHFAAIVDEFALAVESGEQHDRFELEARRQAATMDALRRSERERAPVAPDRIEAVDA